MNKNELKKEVQKRKTFAIISHPDAGKTTITEQLLLLGGVVRETGTVKGRKTGKYAKSDWMEIEKQRGISVTSSVLQFNYDDKQINILDTPGHEDFSEDTYRTLMAVDSTVMVIDAAKGIEPQTKKLFQICKMRGIPIFTFINKMDRDSKDPIDLLNELEEVLGIRSYAMNIPIGMGKTFKGIYDLYSNRLEINDGSEPNFYQLDDPKLAENKELIEDGVYQDALISVELMQEAGNQFDEDEIKKGSLTPVFFGSALSNFGVRTFLEAYLKLAPSPGDYKTTDNELIEASSNEFSGFVFKIQANMNPNHRDRIAFVRICSGEFTKGMKVILARNDKELKLSNSTQFMADDRGSVDSAVAGDIIGLYDTGNFQIGDTIFSGKQKLHFEKLPQFTPEIFMRVSAQNVMKQKSFNKGIDQLIQEGAVQLYKNYVTEEYILGAVGQLQFEVFKFRMENEYNSEVLLSPLGNKIARWINPEQLDEKMASSRNILVKDQEGKPLFLFENEFAERWFKDKYPDVKLTARI